MSEGTSVVTEDRSTTIGALAAALAKAQGAMESASKNARNPHFGSQYADFAAIWDACRGPLSANGLAIIQRVTNDARAVQVTTMLLHASGEWIQDRITVPLTKSDAQGVGSAITYGKRYGLSAMVGVAADLDDDGNAASAPTGKRTSQPEVSARTSNVRTEAIKEKLKAQLQAGDSIVSNIADIRAASDSLKAEGKREATEPSDLEKKLGESVSVMSKMVAVGQRYGLSGERVAQYMRAATGKKDKNQLTLDDVAKVVSAIEADMAPALSDE
jgi:hypothetical protein